MSHTRIIGGIRFVREDDGHYYSEGGRYGIFHLFRDCPETCWELQEIREDRSYVDTLDDDTHLIMFTHRSKSGDYDYLVDDLTEQDLDEAGE